MRNIELWGSVFVLNPRSANLQQHYFLIIMFARKIFKRSSNSQVKWTGLPEGVKPSHLNARLTVHYGIPSSSSVLAFDPLQRILAIATLDGRIKIIGGPGIEYLLHSALHVPCKFLEFLNNQGFLVSITKQNDIELWNLDGRTKSCSLHWNTNITAFSVIQGTAYMYIGDDMGDVVVIKFVRGEEVISKMPYHIQIDALKEFIHEADISSSSLSVVGIFSQPSHSNTRILVTYENGLLMLWDVFASEIIAIRGGTDVRFRYTIIANSADCMIEAESIAPEMDETLEGKEICCSCWLSSVGRVLAVGYTDGDILIWDIPSASYDKKRKDAVKVVSIESAVKLMLSSSERRLPVITLRWSSFEKKSMEGESGLLFIYGGDEVGSPEVITVMCLKWSDGLQNFSCVSSVQLAIHGSFSDMLLLADVGCNSHNSFAELLVLTNPGKLHSYNEKIIFDFLGKNDENAILQPVPIQEPLLEPCVTVAKLVLLSKNSNASRILSELSQSIQSLSPSIRSSYTKWPISGGVLDPLSFSNNKLESLYITGHENGAINIWNASMPSFGHICSIENKLPNPKFPSNKSSISALDYCSTLDILAVGYEQGLVQLYKAGAKRTEVKSHIVTGDSKEVHTFICDSIFHCNAIFDVHHSPICSFALMNGARVGFASVNGLVTVADLQSFEILFSKNCLPNGLASVYSIKMLTVILSKGISLPTKSPKSEQTVKSPCEKSQNIIFLTSTDGVLVTVDGNTGEILVSNSDFIKQATGTVAFHLIEGGSMEQSEESQDEISYKDSESESHEKSENLTCIHDHNDMKGFSDKMELSHGQSPDNFLLLLCLESALLLYPATSVFQGHVKPICNVKLDLPCCWASTFFDNDGSVVGLAMLYKTGALEFRSFPKLDVVGSLSLDSFLSWSYQSNISQTISSAVNGRIAIICNKEMACLSILENENDLRIPESLPSLFDKDLAAASEAALKVGASQTQKKKPAHAFIGGVIKEIKGGVLKRTSNSAGHLEGESSTSDLSFIFEEHPFSQSPQTSKDKEEEILDIDDIEVDDPPSVSYTPHPVSSTTNMSPHKQTQDNKSDRQKLLGEKHMERPRMRTPEEIKAAYGHKKSHDVAAVAGQAKDRLLERGEKLQHISNRTEELQAGAENFSSMADELLKTMQQRKWWQV